MQHRERTLLSWQEILMYSVVPKSKLIVIKGKMHLSESPLQPCPISQMDPLHLSNVLLFEENSEAEVEKMSVEECLLQCHLLY